MSKPLLEKAAERKITRGQKVALGIACTVPLILTAVAMPAFLSADPEPAPTPRGARPAPHAAPAQPVEEGGLDDAPPEDVSPTVKVSEDGDLAVELSLASDVFGAGEPIVSTVRVTNHGLTSLHLPAAREPNATLQVIVLDHEGMEVRRVVETGADPLPLRTVRVDSGAVVALPVTLVAKGETPLPAGTYSAQVEFEADPAWKRLGVPVWTSPNGSIRSYPVFFTVSAD